MAADAPHAADALVAQADALVRASKWTEALALLDEAVALHHRAQQAQREAQCLRMSAALCRFAGRPADAQRRAAQALALVGPDDPLVVAAWTEIAEAAMQQQLADEAEVAWSQAWAAAQRSTATPSAQAALLQRRAVVRAHAGRTDAAIDDLQAACALWRDAGDEVALRRTQAEWATLLETAGRSAECATLLHALHDSAQRAGDPQALADVALLHAAQALRRRDPAAAREAALQARDAALQAVNPVSYFAAARTIATAADAAGDRVQAYRALATAWATLGDLLGADTARAWVTPALEAFKRQWGDAGFAAARAEHDRQRRSELGAR